jgi:signal transduction histidine kinase
LSETVGLLRQAGDPADPPPPAAGLSGLAELLAASRAAGLEVSVDVTGDARGVPAAVDLTAYRLLQESLTNARKHAGPVAVRVTVTYGRDELAIVVDNSAGAAPAAAADGGPRHGLVGMRERVAALGGTLRAGRRPDGGYRVHATLPLGVGEPA